MEPLTPTLSEAITPLELFPIEACDSNYIWCFQTGEGQVAVVDPGESSPVISYLTGSNLKLSHILLTHHHNDHTGGVDALVKFYQAQVIGSAHDAYRLPQLDIALKGGEELQVGDRLFRVIHTPGHTSGHICFYGEGVLFAGDTLFSHGCGRLFEGEPETMWQSLLKLRSLPDTTQLCCAHEYTLTNLEFGLTLPGQRERLSPLVKQAMQDLDAQRPTLPTRLADEKRSNPFLRCDQAAFKKELGHPEFSDTACFAHIRQMRNHH
uniref:Hydroxyacylglutathione hydrolase n=1 Tax=Magnetococcus massalia (strain MO-1) TaxID=451514 RepID=A0A1S7LHJ3_MAGMO|nr:hydroxyacylglutathione hydrolase [Candidatus Magnetococcus massalia]